MHAPNVLENLHRNMSPLESSGTGTQAPVSQGDDQEPVLWPGSIQFDDEVRAAFVVISFVFVSLFVVVRTWCSGVRAWPFARHKQQGVAAVVLGSWGLPPPKSPRSHLGSALDCF